MSDYATLSKRLRELERDVEHRLHEHGKAITGLEYIVEERTRHLQEADRDARIAIAGINTRLDALKDAVTESKTRLAVMTSVATATLATVAPYLVDALRG